LVSRQITTRRAGLAVFVDLGDPAVGFRSGHATALGVQFVKQCHRITPGPLRRQVGPLDGTSDDLGLGHIPQLGQSLEPLGGYLIQSEGGAVNHRRHTITPDHHFSSTASAHLIRKWDQLLAVAIQNL
jgi:hypothetical protein